MALAGPGAPGAPSRQAPKQFDVGRTYRVPYRLTDTKHILIRARVNGHGPYNFVMDTGAPDLFLAAERANEAGCEVGNDRRAVVKAMEIEGGPTLRGMLSRVEELFQLRSMNAIDAAGARIDGVMGYSVLARFRLEIDLGRPEMRWTRLAYTPPPAPGVLELTGGKMPAAAKDAKNMEQMAQWASGIFQRKPAPPPVPRGFLGIELQTESATPIIARLFPGSPAAAARLVAGDRIVAVQRAPRDPVQIDTSPALNKALLDLRAGDEVTVTVERNGETKRLAVRASSGTF